MKNYFRIILDFRNRAKYVDQCRTQNFICADNYDTIDLSDHLFSGIEQFKEKFISQYLVNHPGKKKAADQIGEMLWAFCKEIQIGDIIICPNGRGTLYFGEVVGDYYYQSEDILPHRREVKWLPATIRRKSISVSMNDSLKTKSPSLMITQHEEEIEKYIIEYESAPPPVMPLSLERLLQDFLVENWKHTELGQQYDIFEEDGEIVGPQYPADGGFIDILAISKDKTEFLVVELKKGRASDDVVGQILRYMGFVRKSIAAKDQLVKGIIVASEDDKNIRNALHATQNIKFFRYQVSLKLIEQSNA